MGIITEQFNIVGNYKNALNEITMLSNNASASMSFLNGLIGTLGAGLSITAIARLSDETSQLNQRIRLATIGNEDFLSVQRKLRDIAYETRGSYNDLATTFSKLGMQAQDVFNNNDEIVEFTGNLQKLFTVSGLDTTGIQSLMYNLNQSLSSGALMGQDYRIMKKNAPLMVKIIQDYYKVSRQELDDMVSKGKVSAQDIKQAMLDVSQGGMKEIVEQFNQMPITFGQATTMLGNALREKLEPLLLSVAKVAEFMANNIELIIDGLKVAVVAIGVFNARLLILKAISAGGILTNFIGMLSALPAMFMGSSAAASAFVFSLEGFKTALASTGIGLIPIAIGIAVVAVGHLIEAFGGLKAVWLQIKDTAIVVFESIMGVFARMIEGIVNTYRRVKSFFTGEKYEAYKIEAGVNETAHKKRIAEIEAERDRYKNEKSFSFENPNGLGVTVDNFSSNARGQLTNTVRLANEDVKYISDLAERKYVMQVNLNTMPNVSINQNVNGNGASNLFDLEKGFTQILNQWDGISNYV